MTRKRRYLCDTTLCDGQQTQADIRDAAAVDFAAIKSLKAELAGRKIG